MIDTATEPDDPRRLLRDLLSEHGYLGLEQVLHEEAMAQPVELQLEYVFGDTSDGMSRRVRFDKHPCAALFIRRVLQGILDERLPHLLAVHARFISGPYRGADHSLFFASELEVRYPQDGTQ